MVFPPQPLTYSLMLLYFSLYLTAYLCFPLYLHLKKGSLSLSSGFFLRWSTGGFIIANRANHCRRWRHVVHDDPALPLVTTIITLSPNKQSLFGDTLVNNVGWHHWSVRPLCPWQSGTWCGSRGQKNGHDFVPTGVVIHDSSNWLSFQMARPPSYYAHSAHAQIHPNTKAARNKFYSFLALHFAVYCSSLFQTRYMSTSLKKTTVQFCF